MKTSSSGLGQPPVSRSKAWSYLITNLLVLPGLGSVMGGCKVSGYTQILLGLAGFLITLIALAKIALGWVRDFQLPADPSLYRSAIAGLAVFLVAWIWSLMTSLALLRESQKPPPTL